jgi:hypothetical protein
MKDFRGMKRQRSRNRKPSGNSNNPNRAYESNGPDGVKVRGNAQTIYEKYQQLARDANSSGDRVLAENHLQHAEHYFRLIRQMQPQRPVSEFVQRDPFSNGYDDFDDEIDGEAAPEAEAAEPAEAQAESEARDQRERYDRNRDRNRNDHRDRNDNRERSFQRDQPRDGQRAEPRPDQREDDNGNRRETRRERYERRRAQRLQDQEKNLNGEDDAPLPAYASPSAIASTEPLGAPRPAPQPLVAEAAPEPDVSHLPAFLRAPPPAAASADEAAEAAPKPRRGRRKKTEEVSAEEA